VVVKSSSTVGVLMNRIFLDDVDIHQKMMQRMTPESYVGVTFYVSLLCVVTIDETARARIGFFVV
jgi:hypothetical protein